MKRMWWLLQERFWRGVLAGWFIFLAYGSYETVGSYQKQRADPYGWLDGFTFIGVFLFTAIIGWNAGREHND